MNDLVVKACAVALRKHPNINSSWLGTKIRYNNHIHIGVAMAVEDGLLVPVVRFADQKGLNQISSEIKTYGKKAKEKKLYQIYSRIHHYIYPQEQYLSILYQSFF